MQRSYALSLVSLVSLGGDAGKAKMVVSPHCRYKAPPLLAAIATRLDYTGTSTSSLSSREPGHRRLHNSDVHGNRSTLQPSVHRPSVHCEYCYRA
ncbi:hypothetical protein EDD15DRAFT_193976 [Pisolithus albus]|nr:hypothetical protein EDD15DRAFT_193976 [Pisolithus albus]